MGPSADITQKLRLQWSILIQWGIRNRVKCYPVAAQSARGNQETADACEQHESSLRFNQLQSQIEHLGHCGVLW